MAIAEHRTGAITSGDVTLFYRHFGKPGAAPVLIFHGANYYDSTDWIDIAAALSTDREVVAFDYRGFGESWWSAAQDYSFDAMMGDTLALLDHFGWRRVVAMGHSLGGSYANLFGARFPDRTAAVILVDHCPGEGGGARPAAVPAGPPKPYATLEAAVAATSRDPRTPRDRVAQFCKTVGGGFIFRRDPAFSNRTPNIPGWSPKIVVTDAWADLASIKAPVMVVRGLASDRYNDDRIAKLKKTAPAAHLVEVQSGHDVATAAPQALIDAVVRFLRQKVSA